MSMWTLLWTTQTQRTWARRNPGPRRDERASRGRNSLLRLVFHGGFLGNRLLRGRVRGNRLRRLFFLLLIRLTVRIDACGHWVHLVSGCGSRFAGKVLGEPARVGVGGKVGLAIGLGLVVR